MGMVRLGPIREDCAAHPDLRQLIQRRHPEPASHCRDVGLARPRLDMRRHVVHAFIQVPVVVSLRHNFVQRILPQHITVLSHSAVLYPIYSSCSV